MLVFKLGGELQLPSSEPYQEQFVAPPKQTATVEQIAAGKPLYNQYCATCHGPQAIGGGLIQDIRYGGVLHDAELWDQVVSKGVFASKGMAGFESVLSAEQVANIRAYVVDAAQENAKHQRQ